MAPTQRGASFIHDDECSRVVCRCNGGVLWVCDASERCLILLLLVHPYSAERRLKKEMNYLIKGRWLSIWRKHADDLLPKRLAFSSDCLRLKTRVRQFVLMNRWCFYCHLPDIVYAKKIYEILRRPWMHKINPLGSSILADSENVFIFQWVNTPVLWGTNTTTLLFTLHPKYSPMNTHMYFCRVICNVYSILHHWVIECQWKLFLSTLETKK